MKNAMSRRLRASTSSLALPSSKINSQFACMNAFDGTTEKNWGTNGEGKGSWIKAKFDEGILTKFSYQHRVSKQQYWNKEIRLQFSDGSTQSYQLKAESGVQTFTLLKPVTTAFVKIVVVSHYNQNNNGASEIEFFGCFVDVDECSLGTHDCAATQLAPTLMTATCVCVTQAFP